MKNSITYLKTLWRRVADSQRNDRRHDRRLTVGSPSGFNSKLMLKLVSVLVLILTIGVGNVWGAETLVYTLTCPKNASNNSYTSNYDVTVNGISWKAPGNQFADGAWRIGGKNTSNTNRTVYSQTAISNDISKIVITHGSKSSGCTVNSVTVKVSTAKNATGTVKNTFTPSYVNNGTMTITRPDGADWSNCYYTIIYNYKSSSSSSNNYLILSKIEFYEEETVACSTPPTVGSSLTSVSSTVNSITATVPISSIGGCNITENGLVYSTSVATPTVGAANCTKVTTTACGGTAVNKTVTISGLTCGQSYYVRGYATNDANTSYTNVTTQSTSACPTYTVTLMDDGDTRTQASYGAAVSLPTRAGCTGYTFAGWTKTWTSAQSSWTTTAPTIIPAGSYTPAGDENLYPVYTKEEGGGTSYTKVTSITAGTYIMVSEKTSGTYRYMPNTTSSGSNPALGTGITMSTTAGVTTLTNAITDDMLWDFSTGETSGYFYVRPHGSSTIGLGTTNSTGANIRISTTYVNTEWHFATSSDYGWEITNGSMYLSVYADNAWRNYGNNYTNQNGTFYMFKQTSASTTYYISEPNCCTELTSVNGSVAWSNAAATVSWDDVASMNSWALKYKKSGAANWTDYSGSFSSANSRRSNSTAISGLDAGETYVFQVSGTYAGSTYCAQAYSFEFSSTVPNITTSVYSVTDLNYIVGDPQANGGPSTAQSFTVTGVGITGNLSIEAPANFEICLTNSATASDWKTSGTAITIAKASAESGQTVYVRLKKGLAEGNYGPSNVSITEGGAAGKNVSVSGTVSPACEDPTIDSHPTGATYNMNATATALSVSATKNGVGPVLSYQWYSNTANNNTTGTPISGATNDTYTPSTSEAGTKYYYCIVSSGACSATSNVAAVTVNTPSITVSETTRAFGDKAVNPENPYYTMTFTVSGSNLAKDAPIALALSGPNAGMFSINKTSISQTTGTVSTTTVTVTYNPTAVGSHTATITISSTGATSKTVTLTGTAKYKVTWMSNGVEHHSDLVASGKPTFPSEPSSCDATSTTFYGWATAEWDDKIQSLAGKTVYTEASAMPNVSGNVTYYAVFAKSAGGGSVNDVIDYTAAQAVLSGKNDSQWGNGDITCASGNKYYLYAMGGGAANTYALKWNANGYLYCKSQAVGMGALSSVTIATTADKTINVYTSSTAYTGAPSATSEGTLTATSSGATKEITSGRNFIGLYGGTSGILVKTITITYGTPATYSDYLTNCCEEWTPPTLSYTVPSGWKNGDSDISATISSGTVHGTPSFESSNTGVLEVDPDDGTITAVGAGTATVTVTWPGETIGTTKYCAKSTTSNTITVSGNVTVTFDAATNGGSVSTSTQSVPYNEATALTAWNTLGGSAPSCKTFDHWNTAADDSGQSYNNGANITATSAVTLYAIYSNLTYTVSDGTMSGVASHSYSADPITCGATLTITCAADASHKDNPTVTATGTHGAITVVSATEVTIANVTSDIEVSISYAARENYTITWSSPAGTTTSSVLEGSAVTLPVSDPVSCSSKFNQFVGWYEHEAGTEADSTAVADFASTCGAQITSSTFPNASTTYYAVFSDGSAGGGWNLVTSLSDLEDGGVYTIGSKSDKTGKVLGAKNTNNFDGVDWNDANMSTITLEAIREGIWALQTSTNGEYLKSTSSSSNNIGTVNSYTGVANAEWAISFPTSGNIRIQAQGSYSRNDLRWNNSNTIFSVYAQGNQNQIYLYKQGSSATGYISTCGTNITITNGGQHITSANGIWAQCQDTIFLTGTRMKATYESVRVKVDLTSPNTTADKNKWKIKLSTTSGAGSATYPFDAKGAAITDNDWTGKIAICYTPDAVNAYDTATFTVSVKNNSSPYQEVIHKTFTMYGRSLPDNFVIAVTDGDGNWYAVPADMKGPFSGSGCSALSTYKPFPITVDNTTTPTVASDVPSRAVYTAAARTGAVNSYPQTLSFKSVPLTGDNYYLYGSTTSGDGSATNIQNASNATSEKQKWYLLTENNALYHMHTTQNENLLSYYSGKVGQYNAAGKKESIYLLPISGSTCTYFRAPDVTGVSLDATNYTIQFPVDRGATAWQISTNGGSTWTDLSGTTLVGECSPKTTVQAVLPLATYRGQTIDLKVKAASVCEEEKTTFSVPNPVITVTTPWQLYGVTGQAFDNSEKSINLSGLYVGDGASTTVTSSNSNIHAEFVTSPANGDVAVRLTMTAANATAGDHTTVLTFASTGATSKTVDVTITMQSLALFSFTSSEVSNGGYLNLNTCSNPVTFTVSPIYQGSPLTLITGAGYAGDGVTAFSLFDMTANASVSYGNWSSVTPSALGNPMTIVPTDLTAGHVYQWKYTNDNLLDKNSSGVPYNGAIFTFTAIDGTRPTALVACPVETTSFTANWVDESCAGNTTLEVYSQGSSSTTYFNEAFATTNTEGGYYSNADDKWIFTPTWNTYTAAQSNVTISSGKVKIVNMDNDADKRGFYLLSPKLSEWSATVNSTDIWKVTFTMSHSTTATQQVYLVFDVLDNGTLTKKGTPSAAAKTGVTINEMAMTSATYYSDGNVSKTYSLTISGLDNTDRLRFKGVYTSSPTSLSSTKYNLFISNVKVENMGSKVPVSGSPFTITSCAIKSQEITGLTAGTTYFYTVTNSGNTSSVMTVTTRPSAPSIDFSPAKAVLQTDQNGTVSTRVNLEGQNLTLCNLTGVLGGTNAAYFSVNLSGATYNKSTGEVGGYLEITYSPTAVGNHTATYTIDGVVLNLEGHACPSGYGTMATDATDITKNSATAHWSQSTTGYLMLAENSRVDDELLMNGGFEDDGLDWDGVPNAFIRYTQSRQSEIVTAQKRSGSKALYVPIYGEGQYLYYNNGASNVGALYGAKRTLPAGTYTISAYVRAASNSSSTSTFGASDKFRIGFATESGDRRNAVGTPTEISVNGVSNWTKIEDTFTLTEPTSGYIFIGHATSQSAHFVDDVSLKYTAAGHGNNFTEYPITSATSLALTGLKPHTSYSYYVMNSDGCESNIIDFTTTDSDDPITITADPNPVSLIAAIGSTAKQTVVISEENAYSTILLSVGDCGGRISVSPTSLGAAGGVAVVSFTPLPGDEMGDNGTCTISATTLGLGSPASITVNWSVAAGYDMNTPTIEVTDITNSSITVEHNIEIGEDSEMRIQLDRELSEDEIEENVGDEIFFSKYYEAYSHKKILAIYNPTNEKISLKGTYIWRSKNDYSDWNRETGISLVNYGKETGFIGPQEEIIFYNSQLSYTCEQTKTDMSEWAGTTDQAISYDGDDAFLLVRKVRTGEADYRTPPAESVEEDGMGNPIPLTWRTIVDDDETEWTMLDLIGARAKNNMPDGSGVQGRWSWRNCKTSTTESGDEKGWVGYGYDVNDDPWSSNTCNSQPAGYLLSTNRCLLLRRYTVKSGNNAVSANVGDMNTLGKNAIQSEWKGTHVPTEGDQEAVSCENFSFVGGYDYANYYNAWTPLGESDYVVGDRNSDGSYTVTDINVPKYWCNKLRVEIIEKQTVNGVEVENVRLYEDYKVPIVINTNTTTNTASFFGNPNNPTYSGAEDNAKKDAWRTACADCDIVIRDNAKLEHVTSGVSGFNNMTIYPGAKFDNSSKLGFTLNGLQIQALNDNVGYAIINDNGSTITADNIVHVKRIDDQYWYPFSLPYDCEITAIRQQNGKSMGEYWEDWGIKYYDGADRQAQGESAAAGANSKFWKQMPADGTLHANQAYIIGLFTTEWDGQIKNVYFPPKESSEYTEAGDDAKTTTISKWAAGYDASDDSKTRHYGWNFTASPYISMFGEAVSGQGFNNMTNLIMGEIQNDGSYANTDYVYVSVPDGADSKTYTQVRATATTLEPFKGYFVQAKTNGSDGSLTLTYAKDYRTLSQAPARKATAQKQRVDVDLKAEGNGQSDIAGIVVDDEFTTAYEIGGDLTKMYAAATKPQLYFLGQDNEKMAYIAIPDANAEDIPMELYAPKAGQYIISLNKRSSRTDGAESVELLYNGNVLTNLLIDSCTINANNKGVISGYSVRIRRTAQVITSMDLINGEHVTVITNNGQMSITNLPGDAKVFVYDMTGRLMSTGNADGESVVNIDAPQQGVYNVVVQSAAGKTAIRTIVR